MYLIKKHICSCYSRKNLSFKILDTLWQSKEIRYILITLIFISQERGSVKKQSSLETALQLVQRAVDADKARRYEDALQMYQHALVYFLESINCKYNQFERKSVHSNTNVF